MALSEDEQEFAYRTARDAGGGLISVKEAAAAISAASGIPLTSATILIKVYEALTRGLVFKRALSSSDMNYLLTRIFEDEGAIVLTKALRALELHIAYREGANVAQHAMRQIHRRHSEFAI